VQLVVGADLAALGTTERRQVVAYSVSHRTPTND